MSNYIITTGELYHHGVKGQRWGVRRYQNKNGSLTPSGKKRYIDNDKIQKKAEKRQFKEDVKQYRHDKRILDVDINEYGELSNVRNRGYEMLDRRRVEKGEEYANRIIKSDKRRTIAETVGVLAGSTAIAAGYSYLAAKYNF